MHVGQTVAAALEFVGETFVVDAQQMHDGRVQIVNVQAVCCDVVTELARFPVNRSGFYSTTRHPEAEAARMMVSSEVR